jgi:hypothetical protein
MTKTDEGTAGKTFQATTKTGSLRWEKVKSTGPVLSRASNLERKEDPKGPKRRISMPFATIQYLFHLGLVKLRNTYNE